VTGSPPPLAFLTTYDAIPGEAVRLSPLVQRVLCPNPGPFTFTGTNTYVLGDREVVVVDPGPADEGHVDAIVRAVAGRPVVAIVLTHTHADHSPAAALLQARTGAPTYGFGPHPEPALPPMEPPDPDRPDTTHEGADRDFRPDLLLADGATVTVEGWHLDVVHTPGHIANHLCYSVREEATLLTGDHVMGWSTSVISPRDGDLADFLASCERILDRGEGTYLSAHGEVMRDPHAYVRSLVDHRHHRTRQVLEVLADGPGDVGSIVALLYPGLDDRLVRAAKATITSHLLLLQRQGQAVADGLPSFTTVWALADR